MIQGGKPIKMNPPNSGSLTELAFLFLKLGTVAFGGSAAHVAILEDEVVRRRRGFSKGKFLDLLGVAAFLLSCQGETHPPIAHECYTRMVPVLQTGMFCAFLTRKGFGLGFLSLS